MKTHALSQRLVWIWFVLTTSITMAGFLLFIRNANTPVPASWGVAAGSRNDISQWLNALQQQLITPILISFLGVLILTRRPGHRIGRLLIVLGVVSALGTLTQEWAVYGYHTLQTDVPLEAVAAWITNWIWIILFDLLLLTAALFPDGYLLSRRWAWLIGVPLFLFTVPLLLGAMIETPMSSVFQIPNPFVNQHRKTFYDAAFTTGVVAMPVTAIAVLLSAVVRFRRSQAQERQQMKWLMFGVAIMAFLTVVGLGIFQGLGNPMGAIMVNAAVFGPALGVGIALLRFRLYDIDIIIRRTLQYALLTGFLVLIYFGGVVLLQGIFGGLTGDSDSPLITVISTLVIAALFNPLRGRIQDFIDHRFYRAKYDAQQTLTHFAAAARDEVELEALTNELVHVVQETMQPEHVSIWLKR
ncbi:MAG: hypothetical protein IPL78_22520 [Chloroflexi bacterium]|nr:hypothetical protein [Chloroflexota bacterium]